ncbi:TadE/TadG family type IV pilus assembly protein [Paenibacillus silvisoli]|uniref:TadE/TadG family type IV pilus assembly protein n=1 Tax=Paenibacillus silvisoli TaxID=3110539 RepID=UPI00280556FE|nr:pilus assembly protein [Paenibacillus silvisoli]
MTRPTKSSIRLRRLQAWLRREDGSFTLEASTVFPMIFVSLLALLMLGMYTYQKVVLYTVASLTAERTAFRWDNSYRDAVSGIGKTGEYDGLYWRLTDNGVLQSLFGMDDGAQGDRMSLTIGADMNGDSGQSDQPLPLKKMGSEAARVMQPLEGEIGYEGGLQKRIEVKLRQPLSIPVLEELLGHSEPKALTSAVIVDPVELIRNVDLVRYYAGRFAGQSEQGKSQAREVLRDRQSAQSGEQQG